MRPILTIAIPTYNRAEKLQLALQLVIKYSRDKNIEILVSDNNSSDNTKDCVKAIQKEYPAIQYFCNEKNLGFDGNFLNCFERASGEYVWLLSDDDILLPGAVDSVLEALNKSPVCMHLNSSSLLNIAPLQVSEARFTENGLHQYTNKNDFLKEIRIFCTFISSLIYKVDYVKEIENKKQYFHTNILQSHILLEIMKHDGLYIINTKNCLAARENKTVSYDILKTWVKNYADLLLNTAVICGFDADIMSEILETDLSTTVYEFVITFRKTCFKESEWDRECIWPYINRYPKLIRKYRFAVNCPIWCLQILKYHYKIKRKLCGRLQ